MINPRSKNKVLKLATFWVLLTEMLDADTKIVEISDKNSQILVVQASD